MTDLVHDDPDVAQYVGGGMSTPLTAFERYENARGLPPTYQALGDTRRIFDPRRVRAWMRARFRAWVRSRRPVTCTHVRAPRSRTSHRVIRSPSSRPTADPDPEPPPRAAAGAVTPHEREALTAACREILRGYAPDRLLEDVAATCPSVELARAVVDKVRAERARRGRR